MPQAATRCTDALATVASGRAVRAGGTFDLYQEDGTGRLSLVDHVLTDPTGRFCAMLRRNFFYVARREDVGCSCGGVSSCHAFPHPDGPERFGRLRQSGRRVPGRGQPLSQLRLLLRFVATDRSPS